MAKAKQQPATQAQGTATLEAPKSTMGRYRVKTGVHCEKVEGDETGTKVHTYNTGDIVESKKDLAKWDPDKFELVGPGTIPNEPAEESDEQLEGYLASGNDQPQDGEE